MSFYGWRNRFENSAGIKKTEEMTRASEPQSGPIILLPDGFQIDSLQTSRDGDSIAEFALTLSTRETRTEPGFGGLDTFAYTIDVANPSSRLPGTPHEINFVTADAVIIPEPTLKENLPEDVRRVVYRRLFPPIGAQKASSSGPLLARTYFIYTETSIFKAAGLDRWHAWFSSQVVRHAFADALLKCHYNYYPWVRRHFERSRWAFFAQ